MVNSAISGPQLRARRVKTKTAKSGPLRAVTTNESRKERLHGEFRYQRSAAKSAKSQNEDREERPAKSGDYRDKPRQVLTFAD